MNPQEVIKTLLLLALMKPLENKKLNELKTTDSKFKIPCSRKIKLKRDGLFAKDPMKLQFF